MYARKKVYNNLYERLRIAEEKLRALLSSNQLYTILIQDSPNATVSIKVVDSAGKERVYIGKV